MDTTLTEAQHTKLDALPEEWRVVGWDALLRGPVIELGEDLFSINRRGSVATQRSCITRVPGRVAA